MKKLIVLLAFFMLMKPILPVLEYVVFYDYIKNELCVNKNNKAMQCDGKCHLKKELAKASEGAEKQDKNAGRTFSVESNVVFFQDFSYSYPVVVSDSDVHKANFFYNNLYTHQLHDAVFHPPLFYSFLS